MDLSAEEETESIHIFYEDIPNTTLLELAALVGCRGSSTQREESTWSMVNQKG